MPPKALEELSEQENEYERAVKSLLRNIPLTIVGSPEKPKEDEQAQAEMH